MNPSKKPDAQSTSARPEVAVRARARELLGDCLTAVFNDLHNSVFDAFCAARDEHPREQALQVLRGLKEHQGAITRGFCADVDAGSSALTRACLLDAFTARCAVLPLDQEQQRLLLRAFEHRVLETLAEGNRGIEEHVQAQPSPPRLVPLRLARAPASAPVAVTHEDPPAPVAAAPEEPEAERIAAPDEQQPPRVVAESRRRDWYVLALGCGAVAMTVLVATSMAFLGGTAPPPQPASPVPTIAGEIPTIANAPPAETPAPAPVVEIPAPAVPDPEPASDTRLAQQTRYLLQRGDRALAELRLTEPFEDSAAANYLAVLAIDRSNAQATRGLARIVDDYASMARFQLRKNRPGLAREYLQRARSLQPESQALDKLAQEIDRASRARRR